MQGRLELDKVGVVGGEISEIGLKRVKEGGREEG